MEEMGAESAAKDKPSKRKKKVKAEASLSTYSEEDLNKMLDQVLADEDYERAAEIRDELAKRENK